MYAVRKCFFAATVGFVLAASPAPAQEQKAPDLSDLRDAVKAASKRGHNVGEVAKALDALEKALAKGFTPPKPGETPAPLLELVALRGAVETAGAKGEDVAAIRGELDAIEKTVAGKVFERPKPVPLPVDPPPQVPNFNRRGGIVIQGGAGGGNVVIRGGGNVVIQNMQLGGRGGNAMSITLSGNEFTIKATQEGVQYVIQGAIGDESTILDKVTITDGDKKPVEAKTLKDVPKEYQPAVEKLLKSIGR
jgi:hypothetical protein